MGSQMRWPLVDAAVDGKRLPLLNQLRRSARPERVRDASAPSLPSLRVRAWWRVTVVRVVWLRVQPG